MDPHPPAFTTRLLRSLEERLPVEELKFDEAFKILLGYLEKNSDDLSVLERLAVVEERTGPCPRSPLSWEEIRDGLKSANAAEDEKSVKSEEKKYRRRWRENHSPVSLLQKLTAVDYDASVLWSKVGTTTAYSILVQCIGALGRFTDNRRSLAAELGDAGMVIACAQMLAQFAGCPCYVLYGWDRQLNSPRLLEHGGLIYPETVGGSFLYQSIRDLFLEPATSRITDDRASGEPVMELSDQNVEGSFRRREGVTSTWAIPFRCQSRSFVLFLNHRDNNRGAVPMPEDVRSALSLDLFQLQRKEDRASLTELLTAKEPRDLFPAVRYLNGWLQKERVDWAPPQKKALFETDSPLGSFSAAVDTLAAATSDGATDESKVLEILRTYEAFIRVAVQRVLAQDLSESEIKLYFCNDDRTAIIRPRSGEENAQPVEFRFGHGNASGLLPADSCLEAQALSWKCSLFIDKEERPDSKLAKLAILSPEMTRQAVLPLVSEDKPLGVVTVECPSSGKLSPDHARVLETLGLVLSAVISAPLRVSKALLHGSARKNTHTLLRRLSEYLGPLCQADIAFVLTYEEVSRRFLARGVWLSDAICSELTTDGFLKNLIGSDQELDEKVTAHAVSQYLHPAPGGTSWDIFRSGEPRGFDVRSARERNDATNTFCERFLDGMFGWPLRCHPSLPPTGVVWVGFLRDDNRSMRQGWPEGIPSSPIQAEVDLWTRLTSCIHLALGYDRLKGIW